MNATAQATGLDFYSILQVVPQAHPSVIQAAYRALARVLHPDQSRTDATESAMALLNRAYGVLRDPEQRKAYDVARTSVQQPGPATRSVAAGPGNGGQPLARDAKGTPMTFGRYRGWTLEQLAKQDPEYLVWLKRHSSGIGYRRQIEVILEAKRVAAQPAPVRGGRR